VSWDAVLDKYGADKDVGFVGTPPDLMLLLLLKPGVELIWDDRDPEMMLTDKIEVDNAVGIPDTGEVAVTGMLEPILVLDIAAELS
jgi:hypothetical protein